MLSVTNLSFGYNEERALDDVSIQVPEGSLCALYGPNGSGKSTLMKCCLKLLSGYTGDIRISGKDVKTLSVSDLSKIATYISQTRTQTFPFTVFDIVLMGRNPHIDSNFGPSTKDEKATDAVLKNRELENYRDRIFTELSTGEQQLVILARALNQETPLLLFDEPGSALDYHNQLRIWNDLKELTRSGKTVVVTTHDPNHVLWFCTHAIILKKTVIDFGTPSEVISEKNLTKLYGPVSTVRKIDGRDIVIPKNIF